MWVLVLLYLLGAHQMGLFWRTECFSIWAQVESLTFGLFALRCSLRSGKNAARSFFAKVELRPCYWHPI